VAIVVAAAAAIAVGWIVAGGGSSSSRPRPIRPTRSLIARRVVVHVPAGPVPGLLLIADRGNDRILLVDNRKRILWRYPPPSGPVYPFRFDDDAFFGPGFRSIISNQEEQHTIQIIGFPGGRVLWHYGHVDVRGSAAGYLNTPDDAYELPGGLVSVADAYNCRVLFIDRSGSVVREIGRAGSCGHDPPRTLVGVNGATPLPGGGTLVSEINGSWIDAFSATGRLLWDFHAPVSYPSDPQWLGNGHILLADYTRPGAVLILDTHGHVLWRYAPRSGPGMLDHPSLALRLRPGLIAVNDDYRDRVVLISIRARRILWQYGHTDQDGTAPGYLNTPDGMDLLPAVDALRLPAVRTLLRRAHAASARTKRSIPSGLVLRRAPFALSAPVERAVAAAWQGRILVAGGLDSAGRSAAGVFELDPATGRLQSLGTVPHAFHDAAGGIIRGRLLIFGGGSSTSSDTVQAFDPRTRQGAIIAHLPRPLSDLGAAQLEGSTYLVGGYDGARPRAEILVTRDGRHYALAGRLPVGLRYPAVAADHGNIIVAGGESARGTSDVVYTFNPLTGRVRLAAHLPAPVAHASLIVAGDALYLIGGTDTNGTPTGTITSVDLSSGTATAIAPTSPALADAATARLGQTTFLIGGRGAHTLTTVLEAR
jgi:hypothetical protein